MHEMGRLLVEIRLQVTCKLCAVHINPIEMYGYTLYTLVSKHLWILAIEVLKSEGGYFYIDN